MNAIPPEQSSSYASKNYKTTVLQLISGKAGAEVLEIGGGRSPLLEAKDLPPDVASYTINDISQKELDLAPQGFEKLCFDVCGDVDWIEQRFDVAFSKMLAEHVPDGRKFHGNILKLLKPGGIGFHFMPILYAPPFVINKLLPEDLSRRVLQAFFPKRNDDGIPKFPAHYSMCFGRSEKLIGLYKSIGYEDVDIRVFYGHDYFRKIPVIRELDDLLTRTACRFQISQLAAYAYVKAVKPRD